MSNLKKNKMNQIMTISELENSLTPLEFCLLGEIVHFYEFRNNICFNYKLTSVAAGVMGSLVKKGLVYDSFAGMPDYPKGNFFPSEDVLDVYGLQYYGKS